MSRLKKKYPSWQKQVIEDELEEAGINTSLNTTAEEELFGNITLEDTSETANFDNTL